MEPQYNEGPRACKICLLKQGFVISKFFVVYLEVCYIGCICYIRLCLFLVDNNINSFFGQKVKTRCIIEEGVNFFTKKGLSIW